MVQGNALHIPLVSESVQCVVTSPPYWGLRDYKVAGQLGLEKTPEEYVANMVLVFREIRRVLRKDGTCWLNLGDSYAAGGMGGQSKGSANFGGVADGYEHAIGKAKTAPPGFKPKDLVGIPWRVAFALQADGWWLRSDIIWSKPNCMPESVRDRPTRSHEYLFLLTKSAKYQYDADAIKEPCLYDVDGTGTAARKARQAESNKSMPTDERAGIRPGGLKDARNFDGKNSSKLTGGAYHPPGQSPHSNARDKQRGHSRRHDGFNDRWDLMEKNEQCSGYRNKRDVWTISPAQYPEAHFAVFPEKLVEPCILAGSKAGDIVLDPFAGSGTVLAVAQRFGRRGIGLELNPAYIALAHKRTHEQTVGLAL